MPANPKSSPEVKTRAEGLIALGIEERLALTAAATEKTFTTLHNALTDAGLPPGSAPDPSKAAIVYKAVTKMGTTVGPKGRRMICSAIADGRISDTPHVEAAATWLVTLYRSQTSSVPDAKVRIDDDDIPINVEDFNSAAGVGVVVTQDDMVKAVNAAIDDAKQELIEKRYRFNTGIMQRDIMAALRFADGKVVGELIKEKVAALLGPKTEADMAKPPKVKKTKTKSKPKAEAESKPKDDMTSALEKDPYEGIPSKFEARGLASAENTPELIEKHKQVTGGKVICRFPPEPNGYPHFGHAKAMFLDFGYAMKMGGECILRYDDTNPEAEKVEYTNAIKEMVEWMGYKPAKITYSSDYFDELYDLAKELIRRGKAYICHQNSEGISQGRKDGVESPYRNRSVEENLRLFEDMRKGMYDEGEATLRMKIDMQHPNLVMRDPVAYRVRYVAHPHVGDKWCIYPSYDYTHCLVDSLEWVTHSLCTLEFEIRRDSYYWLLEALDLYRPFVWEFSRLNIEYTVMSKRKLKELVQKSFVRGWDDPRMPTLSGMRRRGYTPEAIRNFCSAIGLSRADNMIGMHVLEYWIRSDHNAKAKRALAVLQPLKVTIKNFKEEEELVTPNHPDKKELGERKLKLTKTVFIEQKDFRMEDNKGYYGLAPGKIAMLRYAYPIKVVDVVKGPNEQPIELIVEMDYEKSTKPKGVLHWVGENGIPFEARIYNTLFKSADPSNLKTDWLEDFNTDSETVMKNGIAEAGLKDAKVGDTFQFERTGYFTVDPDSTEDKLVFNMTVSLRDSR